MHYDVLIVGAGISGIDAAFHLKTQMPVRSFAMIDSQSDIGGTWRTHRFPGIRSDSDLYTFGFNWKPWTGIPIATAPEILSYLNEALDENDLRRHIRFDTSVRAASWSSEQALWTLTLVQPDGSETEATCSFLWMCSGYYRHDRGYTPDWPGMDQFKGEILHPQTWPETADYTDKNVVIIGSGATAATLVPAMAKTARHVTMLQRSPTYFYAKPMQDDFTDTLRGLDLPPEWFHEIMRRKVLEEQRVTTTRAITEPDVLADELVGAVRYYLGPDFDVERHFRPAYRPWQQRLAMVPDGDMFKAIREGHASVVTDNIDRFLPDGIALQSGERLDADLIVTATGFDLNALGDVSFDVDGTSVDVANCFTHQGILLTDLPNLAMVFGYLRTSWTMRANLVSEYVCRLLRHMEAQGLKQVVPALPAQDRDMEPRPWIEQDNFSAGYVQRRVHLMPKQGDRQPWLMTQDYFSDRETLPASGFDDGTLRFA